MIKKLIVNSLASGPLVALGGKVFRQYVPIFMLHRFKCDEIGINGHKEGSLIFALEFLRKHKFNFLSIDDIVKSMVDNEPLPERSIAFSLDDGYWDQVEVAGHTFASYDCPATYFVVTGFVNGDLWLWDSKIHYLIESLSAKQSVKLEEMFPHLNISGGNSYSIASKIVVELSVLTKIEIDSTIASLAKELEVEIPDNAPDKYRATTWQRLKDMERMGLKIGAHTYSHPLLSRESELVAKQEMLRSKQDLALHIDRPSEVFCYPTGRDQDFGNREIKFAQELGFTGAVSAIPGLVDTLHDESHYALPRYGFPDNREGFIQYATWIESFNSLVRGS
jgi:peptidoglycan/xylan/chitin deacetylase (PgdA/CDA1 family)